MYCTSCLICKVNHMVMWHAIKSCIQKARNHPLVANACNISIQTCPTLKKSFTEYFSNSGLLSAGFLVMRSSLYRMYRMPFGLAMQSHSSCITIVQSCTCRPSHFQSWHLLLWKTLQLPGTCHCNEYRYIITIQWSVYASLCKYIPYFTYWYVIACYRNWMTHSYIL